MYSTLYGTGSAQMTVNVCMDSELREHRNTTVRVMGSVRELRVLLPSCIYVNKTERDAYSIAEYTYLCVFLVTLHCLLVKAEVNLSLTPH
jgi:hypothetical protein